MRSGDLQLERKFHVSRDLATFGFGLYVLETKTIVGESSTVTLLTNPTEIPYRRGEQPQSLLTLSDIDCQALMDELYNVGFRPSENKYGSEVVGALRGHLDDMRRIVQEKMDVDLGISMKPKLGRKLGEL